MVEVMKKVSVEYVENVKVARGFRSDVVVLDMTVDGAMGKMDPSCPVGGLRVPGIEGEKGLSLKGIWEGLKMFSKKREIDEKWWRDEKRTGKVRNCKSYGRLEGLRIGEEVVDMERSMEIFREIYKDFVRERFGKVLEGLRREKRDVVLLDYAPTSLTYSST